MVWPRSNGPVEIGDVDVDTKRKGTRMVALGLIGLILVAGSGCTTSTVSTADYLQNRDLVPEGSHVDVLGVGKVVLQVALVAAAGLLFLLLLFAGAGGAAGGGGA